MGGRRWPQTCPAERRPRHRPMRPTPRAVPAIVHPATGVYRHAHQPSTVRSGRRTLEVRTGPNPSVRCAGVQVARSGHATRLRRRVSSRPEDDRPRSDAHDRPGRPGSTDENPRRAVRGPPCAPLCRGDRRPPPSEKGTCSLPTSGHRPPSWMSLNVSPSPLSVARHQGPRSPWRHSGTACPSRELRGPWASEEDHPDPGSDDPSGAARSPWASWAGRPIAPHPTGSKRRDRPGCR